MEENGLKKNPSNMNLLFVKQDCSLGTTLFLDEQAPPVQEQVRDLEAFQGTYLKRK